MGTVVNVHQAKTHLSRLLQRVRQGVEIVIAKFGVPVAQALGEGLPLVSGDPNVSRYPIEAVW